MFLKETIIRGLFQILTKEQAQLVEDNISFAYFLTFKYTNAFRFLEKDDIESAALFALMKAARSYDQGKGNRFTTYAARCIHNEVLMLVRAQQKHMGTISIETPVIRDDSKVLTIADTLAGPDIFQMYFQNQTVSAALDSLNEKERYLIIECVVKHRRQKEVGEEFGISQSYISRLVRKAKKKMKKAAIKQGWEG